MVIWMEGPNVGGVKFMGRVHSTQCSRTVVEGTWSESAFRRRAGAPGASIPDHRCCWGHLPMAPRVWYYPNHKSQQNNTFRIFTIPVSIKMQHFIYMQIQFIIIFTKQLNYSSMYILYDKLHCSTDRHPEIDKMLISWFPKGRCFSLNRFYQFS